MRWTVLVFLLTLACSRATPVPRDTQLWHVEGWAAAGEGIRTAPATIIVFRSSGEFVSLQTTVIERADETVYLLSRAPRRSVRGRWEQRGDRVRVCDRETYRVIGNSVESNGVTYSPVTRLVAPEFEAWLRSATTECP